MVCLFILLYARCMSSLFRRLVAISETHFAVSVVPEEDSTFHLAEKNIVCPGAIVPSLPFRSACWSFSFAEITCSDLARQFSASPIELPGELFFGRSSRWPDLHNNGWFIGDDLPFPISAHPGVGAVIARTELPVR